METVEDLEMQLHHAENDLDLLTHWLNIGYYPANATKEDLEKDYDKVRERIRELKSKIRKAKRYESKEV